MFRSNIYPSDVYQQQNKIFNIGNLKVASTFRSLMTSLSKKRKIKKFVFKLKISGKALAN